GSAPPGAGDGGLRGGRSRGRRRPLRARARRVTPHRGQPRAVGDLRGDDGGLLLDPRALRRRRTPPAPSPGTPRLRTRSGLARASRSWARRSAAGDGPALRATPTPAIKQIASGLRFPEGPVSMPDGSVILVEIERRTLSRVAPDGEIHVIA